MFQEHVSVLFHSKSPNREWLPITAVCFQIYSRLVEKVTHYDSRKRPDRSLFFYDRGEDELHRGSVYWENNRSPKSVFICTCYFVHNGTFIWLKEYRANHFTRMICPCTVSPVNWTQIGLPLPSLMHVFFFPFQVETNRKKKPQHFSSFCFTVADTKIFLLFGEWSLVFGSSLCYLCRLSALLCIFIRTLMFFWCGLFSIQSVRTEWRAYSVNKMRKKNAIKW